MLFKLAFKNMKKSIKDYGIYFLTLLLGVAIFYMFNSLDSQEAMLQVSQSQKQIIKLMIEMLGIVSVFVAVILGLLIVYANNFLINRRKKEFGIYMTLGMGKRQISKIILMETIFVGIISLVAGIVVGIFASQFMSVLVAKMFEADMSKFEFVFSKAACIKTCVYFALMYIAVAFFNTITISRYKLINLLTAIKKNEKIKIKNPIISILIFIIACSMLGYAYWKVTADVGSINKIEKLLPPVLLGIVSTILIFWSLSGFILKIVQMMKGIYLKDANMFVLRQLHNKINTTVISMSVICLMLFMTITVLSSSLSLRNSMSKDIKEMTPVDINLYKSANLSEVSTDIYGREKINNEAQREDSKIPMIETLKNNGADTEKLLKDVVEIPIYAVPELTFKTTLGEHFEEIQNEFAFIRYETVEEIIKISDYNKIARLYGITEYTLDDDEYIVLCNFESMEDIRNRALSKESTITIKGEKYKSKYDKCQSGFIEMASSHVNTGIILVPDNCKLDKKNQKEYFLAANYNTDNEEEKEKIENIFASNDSELIQNIVANGLQLDGTTKISIIESSAGLAAIVTFIAIYLGIVFLIASSAILALKQLTESSDNKQRYMILRKIGCDEKMINKSLFRQIGIFFATPLILAIIHSIFGIQFALSLMSGLASKEELLPSAIATVIIITVVYGAYFMATYFGSKNIIKEE